MASDVELRSDILAEVAAERRLHGRRISVAVTQGKVTMRGCVSTYAEKALADQAAHRIGGRHSLALGVSIKNLLSRGDAWAHHSARDDFQETLVDVHRCEL